MTVLVDAACQVRARFQKILRFQRPLHQSSRLRRCLAEETVVVLVPVVVREVAVVQILKG
ncbi:hypothetical protein ACGFNU_17835 [Spirillospora sp. NPDC048911]|uniref:hypothetical protein n=1 Tax=Spirillospora sp. NPDC048911 TaxID=3364527 RepID=UPI00371FD883